MTEQCCRLIYRTGDFQASRCMGRVVHHHDGKPYCGAHYPPNVKARREKSNVVLRERLAAEQAARRDARITAEVRRRCEEWFQENRPASYRVMRTEVEETVR